MPSAAAFDALFRRVDIGDLTALSAAEQRKVVRQLAQLLPPGDAHRARLLDTQRCGLDFTNDNQKGYAFADKHLAEALAARDDAAAIRFYYCRGGYLESLKTPRDALADFERGIDLARAAGKDAMLASGLQARGGMYSLLGIYGKALADLLEAQRIFTAQELDEAAS
ncbi:MAG: GGDEF domain-containing protein, partial [Rudaea sp.]